jgi:TonB family protein
MSTTAICTELEGCVIDGRFRLVRWLGGGPRGGVYLAEVDGDASRKASLKLIAADIPGAQTRLAGWTAAASLSHPHLIRVLQAGRFALDTGEVVYVATEFADEVLGEILPERPLTSEETREMLGPVLDALAYLHTQSFAHGRLKPSNILVVEDQVRLSADCFSLTEAASKSLPEPGAYGAPETGRGEISPAADVWSLGMTLVATLAQHPPAWENAISAEPVVPAMVPEPFAGIARDCLRLDPARRSSLSEVRARLWPETAPRQPAPVAPAQVPPAPPIQVLDVLETPETPSVPPRASGRAAVLIGGGILVVGVAVAVLVHTHQAPPPASVPAPVMDQPPASAAPAARPPAAEQTPAPASSAASSPRASEATPMQPSPTPPSASIPAVTAAPPAEPRAQTAPQDSESSAEKGDVAKRVLPDVLPKAQATIHGTVRINVRVDVSPNGDVSNAVPESPDASRYFTRLAVEAAKSWKFVPKATASVRVLQFEFRRDGTDATAK